MGVKHWYNWMAWGLLGISLCSCATVDHGRELQHARERVGAATSYQPEWCKETPLRALPIEPGDILSAHTAIELALLNNRALRAEFETLAQAKAELVQAGLLPNPSLSVMLAFPEGGGLANLAFSLSQDLAALWLIPIQQKIAEAEVQRRILMLADNATALVAEVRMAYANAQYQRLAAQFQEENLRILADARLATESRVRVGASQLDLNLIRGRYTEAEVEVLQIRNEYRLSQRTLLRLMGAAMETDDWMTTSLEADRPYSRLATDEVKLVELALLQRLDAQAASWELEAAVASIQNERRRLLPSLELGVSGERFERRAMPDRDLLADTARASIAAGQLTPPMIDSVSQRRKERRQEIEFILGPSLDIPIPLFDQNQAQIYRAQHRARELQERYAETEQRIVEGVRKAATSRRLAEERVALYRQSLLPLQRSSFELAQATYQTGRESILAVLEAQESLIRTRLNYAGALRDLELAAAELERQISGPLQDFVLHPTASGPVNEVRAAESSKTTQPANDQEPKK